MTMRLTSFLIALAYTLHAGLFYMISGITERTFLISRMIHQVERSRGPDRLLSLFREILHPACGRVDVRNAYWLGKFLERAWRFRAAWASIQGGSPEVASEHVLSGSISS